MGGVIVIRMSYVGRQRVFYILAGNDSNSRTDAARVFFPSRAAAALLLLFSLEPVYGIRTY